MSKETKKQSLLARLASMDTAAIIAVFEKLVKDGKAVKKGPAFAMLKKPVVFLPSRWRNTSGSRYQDFPMDCSAGHKYTLIAVQLPSNTWSNCPMHPDLPGLAGGSDTLADLLG